MSLKNLWHHRKVADGSAKACWICYKPSTSVLITPNNKDFFYVCVGHLSDRGFCQPDADEAAAAAARNKKEELDLEIEQVKKEYEEKQRIKREKRKEKAKEKDKEKEKDAKKTDEEEDKSDEKTKDDKVRIVTARKPTTTSLTIAADQRALKVKRQSSGRSWASHIHPEQVRLVSVSSFKVFSADTRRNFYQMRIDRIRNAEAAKRNRERLSNPANLPSPPSGFP
ncbi:UPF0589 protein C32H8.01c [Paraphaeosphaeria minitans]|uniref:UPF0589 protein C32H8.01c n=1 Tax=Paraphaeosphaeria minitans TaxID=565426 RepID=A0A9P6GPG4_9PLEO|nr:UPF0589 protein C32H8.01c [Paraphaeosphaeria minitans]